MGKFAEIDVMDALRNGKLGDAAAAFRDAERFQPVGQDQLVHAAEPVVVIDQHRLCAGTDGQLGGVFLPLAAEEHAAAVQLRAVGKPLIPLRGVDAGVFHIGQ